MRRTLIFALIGLTILILGAIFYVGHHFYNLPVAGLFVSAVAGGFGVLLMRHLRGRGGN